MKDSRPCPEDLNQERHHDAQVPKEQVPILQDLLRRHQGMDGCLQQSHQLEGNRLNALHHQLNRKRMFELLLIASASTCLR